MGKAFKKESIGFVAQERVYLTTDDKIVLAQDKRAAHLLAAKGDVVPEKVAKRLKLDNAEIEPLEESRKAEASPHGGFDVVHGGYKQAATIAPEEIASRSVRPETPAKSR